MYAWPLVAPSLRYDRQLKASQWSDSDAIAAAASYLKNSRSVTVERLEGGYSNGNFKVTQGETTLVIRFYADGIAAQQKECAVLDLASRKSIAVPKILFQKVGEAPFAIMEFLDGKSLEVCLTESILPAAAMKFVGAQMAKIHQIQLPHSGLFDEKAEFKVKFSNYNSEAKKLIQSCLKSLAGKRLGVALTEQTNQYVEKNWHSVESTFDKPVLLHSDYNPKNILISLDSKPPIVSVLDWEFAMSGHFLADLGNFFRFHGDYSKEMIGEFLIGYQEIHGPLPQDWEMAARLLDLMSLCFFLNRKEELPRTFDTARSAIENYITSSLKLS